MVIKLLRAFRNLQKSRLTSRKVVNLQKISISYRLQMLNKYFSYRGVVTEQPRDVYGRFLYKIFHITRRFQHLKWATDQ